MINREERFSSKKAIAQYRLGTTANVARIKQALTEKEIIDEQQKIITLLDPVYHAWLARYYFARRK